MRYGSEPSEGSEPSRDGAPEPLVADAADDEAWHKLGGRMSKARIDGGSTRVNEELEAAAETTSTPGLAMVFRFWIAENHKHAGDYETARVGYDDLLERREESGFLDMDFRNTLLRRRATMEEELDRVDAALSTYDELVEQTYGEAARPYFRKGVAAERAGMTRVAIRAYENAANAEDPIEYLDENPELWGYTSPGEVLPDYAPTPTATATPTPTPTPMASPTTTPTATPQPQTNNYPAIDIAAPFRTGEKFRAGGFPHGSGGGCGFGVAGYFYDEGPTHRASNAKSKYAVDVT